MHRPPGMLKTKVRSHHSWWNDSSNGIHSLNLSYLVLYSNFLSKISIWFYHSAHLCPYKKRIWSRCQFIQLLSSCKEVVMDCCKSFLKGQPNIIIMSVQVFLKLSQWVQAIEAYRLAVLTQAWRMITMDHEGIDHYYCSAVTIRIGNCIIQPVVLK